MAAPNSSDDKPDVMMVETAIRDDLEGNPDKAPKVLYMDGFSVLGLSPEDAEFYENYSVKNRKKTMHKVSTYPGVEPNSTSPSCFIGF